MTSWSQIVVYTLCFITCVISAVLLIRGYRRARVPLLFWVALCFIGLSANNFILIIDVLVIPTVDLLPVRQLVQIGSLVVLLYGFIWKTD